MQDQAVLRIHRQLCTATRRFPARESSASIRTTRHVAQIVLTTHSAMVRVSVW